MNHTIFRQYDIRGIVNQTLFVDDAYHIGRYFAHLINYGTVCVGRDGRLSSRFLEQALIEGLTNAGSNVIRIGMGPTPMLNFAGHHLRTDAAIMVTGSHNPPDHNGFKLNVGGAPFYGENIVKLSNLIKQSATLPRPSQANITSFDISQLYIEKLNEVLGSFKLKIAWDPGNGATGDILQALVQNLAGQHIIINGEVDGNFPSHHPDPIIPSNLTQLINTVLTHGCDLGIAFDGDGDRIGVVDHAGAIITSDQLLTIFALDHLRKFPGAKIIADVKTSQSFFETVAALGGKPIMWKTGHSFIRSKLKESGALLGGEFSGHIFFADEYLGYDDGLYAALRLIRLMTEQRMSLHNCVQPLVIYATITEIHIPCSDQLKFILIDEIKARMTQEHIAFYDLDGIRYIDQHGWWLLRASNTTAALVARVEGVDLESLAVIKQALIHQLERSNIMIPVGLI
jgi:phosphomannomutase